MLIEKPWKTDAVMRLVLSIVVCLLGGSFVSVAVQSLTGGSRANPWLYVLLSASLGCLVATLVLLHRPWRIEDALRRLTILLIFFYGGVALGTWAHKIAGPVRPSVNQMIVSALCIQGGVLILAVPFLREHQMGYAAAFGLKRQWPLALLLGIALACLFVPAGHYLQETSAQIMARLHMKPEPQQVVQTLQMESASSGRAVFGWLSILLVPPAEEIFFRGILYPWIKRIGYPGLALWGTSFAFATVHFNLVSFLPLALFALALAVLYEWTDNLLAPISAHMAFNAANLLMFSLERPLT